MKNLRKVLLLLSIVVVLGNFTACNSKKVTEPNQDKDQNDETNIELDQQLAPPYYPITIEDKFGNEVVLEEEPEKVISFSPELVEIMYALNIGDKLIGKSSYCDYPEETSTVPDMGDLFNLNIETIVENNPDLVLLSSMASADLTETIKNQGITVLVLDADTSIEGTYEYIDSLGKVFNKKVEAGDLISKMKSDIEYIGEKVKDLEHPSVYFIVGFGEFDSTATGDTFTGELMELAGATNAASDGENWMYSLEQLVDKDPEYLICSKYYDARNQIIVTEGYKDLTAVKENRLFEVDENIFFRQGPRIVDAIQVLAEYLHPEAFQ